MTKEENDTFAKQIHLPSALKKDLDIMAIEAGHGNMKTMIQKQTIALLIKHKEKK